MKKLVYSKKKQVGIDTSGKSYIYTDKLVSNEVIDNDGEEGIPKVVLVAKMWGAAKVALAKKRVQVVNIAKKLAIYKPSKEYFDYIKSLKEQERKLKEKIDSHANK